MAAITINVSADVADAVAGLTTVNVSLGQVSSRADKAGRSFGGFAEHVRDLAVAQLAVNALTKGFPDLSFGVSSVAEKATLLTAAFTSAVAAGAPVVGLAAGLGAAVVTAGAGIGAFVGLVKPAFTSVFEGVKAATDAQTAYNAALATGDGAAASQALQARTAALAALTPAQRVAAEATLTLNDAFRAQSDAFSLPVLSAYTRGIGTLQSLLPQIVQVANPARDALIGIFDRLDAYAQTPEFHAFLQFLATQVGPTITKLGEITFQFGGVLKNVFVAAAPIAQTALDVITQLVTTLNQASAGSGLTDFFTAMQPLVATVGQLIASVVRTLGQLVQAATPLAGPVLSAVTALSDALGKLFQSQDFQHFVLTIGAGLQQITPLFDTLSGVVGKVMNALGTQLLQVLPTIIPLVQDFAKVFGDVLVGLSPLLGPIAKLVDALVTGILPIVGQLIPVMKEALVPLINALAQVIPQLIPSIIQVVQAITPLLPQIVQLAISLVPLIPSIVQLSAQIIILATQAIAVLLPFIQQLVQAFGPSFQQSVQQNTAAVGFLSQAFTALTPVVQNTLQATGQAVQDGLGVVSNLMNANANALAGNWSGVWDNIKAIAAAGWDGIKTLSQNSGDQINQIIALFAGTTAEKIQEGFAAAGQNAARELKGLLNSVKAIPGEIKGFFSDAGTWLVDAGKNIIDGLIKGIKDSSPLVKGALGALTSSIPDWKGPPATDVKLLYGAGQLIMQGLVNGLDQGERGVMRQLQGTTERIAGAFSGTSSTVTASLSGFGSAGSGGAGAGAGGRTYAITVQTGPVADPVAVGRAVVEAIDAYESAGGRR